MLQRSLILTLAGLALAVILSNSSSGKGALRHRAIRR